MEAVLGKENLVFIGAKEDSLRADEEEANHSSTQSEGVGENHGLPVHHHQANEEEAEDGKRKRCYIFSGSRPVQPADLCCLK
jgi:hypothetical protein